MKPIKDIFKEMYDSLELFLRNWKVMEVVSDGRA